MNAAVFRAATRDVDEQAALLSGWNQSYAQLSAGAFEGQIDEAWLDGLHLFVERTSVRLQQHGALRPNRLAIGVPLAPVQGPALFCGASDWRGDARHGRFCTFSGAMGFEFHTPPGLVMAGLEVDLDELRRLTTPDEQVLVERLSRSATLHSASRQAIDGLRDFMRGAFEMLGQQPGLLDNPAMRSMLRQAAQSNLLEVLASVDTAPAATPSSSQRPSVLVAQARALVDQEPEAPISVATLCQALQVSRRTLQAAFQEVLGLAPAAYLRAVRLAGARRALRHAESVTAAAAQWGFWHFSHFVHDYRRMFGELPSSTWRRLHAREPLPCRDVCCIPAVRLPRRHRPSQDGSPNHP
jgi:AraC family ethanolamine operon transcriptional activator